MPATAPSELPIASTLPDLAHAGARGGIASAFAYAKIRETLFPGEPRVAIKIKGRYTLLEKLGEGTTGAVFAAYDSQLDRKVALKVLRAAADHAGHRLLQEARNLARISDPHVVQVHDADQYRGEVFLTMELVVGEALDEWMKRARPPLAHLLDVLLAVGRGLAAAHAQGIVHRDVKPANILVGRDGRARVADFGIAWTEQHDAASHAGLHTATSMISTAPAASLHGAGTVPGVLTYTGAGTPAYMAPEQCDRRQVDARSDVFSFCVVAWEAIFGARPFAGDSATEVMLKICEGEVAPVVRPRGVSLALEAALRRGLAKDPGQRYPSMMPLLAALEQLRHPRPRRWWLWGTLAAGAVVVGLQSNTGRCMWADAEIDGVWSSEHAEKVMAEFERAGGEPGRAAGQAIVGRVDAFVAELRAASAGNCEDHHDSRISPAQYHRGQRCLEERRLALAGTVVALVNPTPGLLAVSPADIDEALGSVERCRDLGYLAADVAAPEAEDRAAVAEVAEMRRQGEVKLLRGEFAAAATVFADAVERARGVGHAPTTSLALLDLGRTYVRLSRGDAAEPLLREARSLADGAGDDWTAADAGLQLVGTAVERGVVRTEGTPRYQEALAKLRRIHAEHGRLRGELEVARAELALALERPEEAAEALALAEAEFAGPEIPAGLGRVRLWRALALFAERRGDTAAALAAAREISGELKEYTGDADHPLFVTRVARVLMAAGELEAAEASLRRSLKICEAAFGRDSVPVAEVHLALAELYERRGDQDLLFAAALRADEIFRGQTDATTRPQHAENLAYLGRAYKDHDRVDEAIAAYGRGLAALAGVDASVYDPIFALLAASRADILRGQVDDGLVRAAADVEAALVRFPAVRWATKPEIATFMLRVAADVALARGDREAVQAHAEAALGLLATEDEPSTRGRVVYALAQALEPGDSRIPGLSEQAIAAFTRAEEPENAKEVREWAEKVQQQSRQ